MKSSMGKSHFLISIPKKTRYQEEAEHYKVKGEEAKSHMKQLEDKINELNYKIEELKQREIEADENAEKLSDLSQMGVIDEEGRFI